MKIRQSLTNRLRTLETKIDQKLRRRTMRSRLTMTELLYLFYYRKFRRARDAARHWEERSCAVQIAEKALGIRDHIYTRLDLVVYIKRYYSWREGRKKPEEAGFR